MLKLSIPAIAVLTAAVAAGTAGGVKLPRPPSLPPGWSHAEINVVVKRVPHTLTYDRGRVMSAGSSSLVLREPDGSVVTIAIDSKTQVVIGGRPATIDHVRRFEIATTVTVDGGPAAVVKVRVPPGLAALGRGAGR